MVGERGNPRSTQTSTTFVTDHHDLPLQGEFSMKNEDTESEKNPSPVAVQTERDMEKVKLMEEIIASEILRRQELEAEVRRELAMEKQIMGMRRFYRDSCVVDDPYLNSGFSGLQGASLFHRSLMNPGSSYDGFREKLNAINPVISGVDTLQQMYSDPPKSNVFGDGEKKQHIHGVEAMGKRPQNPNPGAAQVAGKSMGEGALVQAMHSSGISGMKRKAETSAPIDEENATVASQKLQKKKWYCSLCKIHTTSAEDLDLHFDGRKHKAKEGSSKSCKTASNISIHSYSADNSTQHAKDQVHAMEEDTNQATEKWECSICQISANSEIFLRSHLQGKKHKAKEAKLGTSQGLGERKLHCPLCNVIATSEKTLQEHFQGKKHKAKAGLLHSVDNDAIEKISGDVKTSQDKNLEGDKVPDDEQSIVDSLISGKIGSEGNTSNDEGEKQDTNYGENIEPKGSEGNDQGVITELVKVWFCRTCNEDINDEAAMARHRKSSEHLNKLRQNGGAVFLVSSMLTEVLEG